MDGATSVKKSFVLRTDSFSSIMSVMVFAVFVGGVLVLLLPLLSLVLILVSLPKDSLILFKMISPSFFFVQ